jgi:hypothetical protein
VLLPDAEPGHRSQPGPIEPVARACQEPCAQRPRRTSNQGSGKGETVGLNEGPQGLKSLVLRMVRSHERCALAVSPAKEQPFFQCKDPNSDHLKRRAPDPPARVAERPG